ncbi:MAG: prepilin-type N-terminal cleavage/methylation domain-containing protein [Lachnospiraceae bacterium]
MKKKNNAGFSIVEVLIALAIFLILMIPIVKGIVQALNMSTGSKELQYRNEFAEGIMEHVKSVNIDELLDSKYYLDSGTDASSFTTTRKIYSLDTTDPDYAGPPLSNDFNGDGNLTADEYFEYAQYQISGSVKLGTKHEKYNYIVDVDSKPYAEAKSNDEQFLDPNNLALGIVEDIDYTKVALIDDQVFNYDAMAENALKAKKLQAVKDAGDEEEYRQALADPFSYFIRDNGYRMMTIRVSGNKTDGYKVQCVLDYYDDNSSLDVSGSDSHYVEYVPYGKVFKDNLPNIYLMYNPCRYNGSYVTDDYITIDTSELTDTTTPVNVFVVQTASNYSESIVNSGAIQAANDAYDEAYRSKHEDVDQATLDKNHLSDDTLYNSNYGNAGQSRDDTQIHMAAVVGTNQTGRLPQLHIYSNIGDNTKETIDDEGNIVTEDKRNQKSDSSKFLISQSDSITDMSNNFFRYMAKNNLTNPTTASIYGLLGNTGEAVVGYLEDASEQSRGMYYIKVYLKKDSDGAIDTAVDQPILQGTKGGTES